MYDLKGAQLQPLLLCKLSSTDKTFSSDRTFRSKRGTFMTENRINRPLFVKSRSDEARETTATCYSCCSLTSPPCSDLGGIVRKENKEAPNFSFFTSYFTTRDIESLSWYAYDPPRQFIHLLVWGQLLREQSVEADKPMTDTFCLCVGCLPK